MRQIKKRAKWVDKEEATRRNSSQCGSRDISRRVSRDLSPWRREHWGACSGNLNIGSLTSEKLYSTIFWPSPSSSKSLLKQTSLLSINLGFSFSVLSPGWKVFLSTISIFYDLSIFLPSLPINGLGAFSSIDSLSNFPPQSFHHQIRRFFTSDMTFRDSSASLQG